MQERVLTISYVYYRRNRKVPILRILGVWLQDSGFNICDKVTVHQDKPDELIIRKVPSQNNVRLLQ